MIMKCEAGFSLHSGHARHISKEVARMNHVKAVAYKLVVFSLVLFVVYKISMKQTQKDTD